MADELFPSLKTLRRSQKEGFDLFADLSAPSKKDELTLRQYLMMIEAKKRAKKHLSFGDIVKGMGKGFVGGANWLLDKLMRPSFAVTAAASEAIGGKSDTPASNILEAAAMGFTGKIRKGWGEILHEQGVGGGKALRGVLGFTLDVATDPIMYLSLGTAAPAKGAIKEVLAAKNAGKVIPKELVRKAVSEASEQMLTHGKVEPFFKEIFEMGGKEAKHRLAYFDFMQKKGLRALEMPKPELRALSSMKAILGRGAIEESRTFDKRYMVVKLGTLKHNLVLPIMPIISRPGKLLVQRNVPILSQLADKTGKAFNPTWDETTIKSMRFTRDRVAEYNAQVQVKEISKILEGVGNKLSVEDQLKALHYMEKPLKKNKDEVWKAVIKEGSTYRLNPAYLSHLRQRNLINDVQEDFIERYFDATEELWRNDKAAGINVQHFGETGRMYVPHVVVSAPDISGLSIRQKNLLTKAGFQHHRQAEISLFQVKQLVDNKEIPAFFELDPLVALTRRSRAGAERQADMALLHSITSTVAIPTRIVDAAKVKKQEAILEKEKSAYEGSMRLLAAKEKEYQEAIDQAIQQKTKEVVKTITKLKGERRKQLISLKKFYRKKLERRLLEAKRPETRERIQKELNKLNKRKFSHYNLGIIDRKIKEALEEGEVYITKLKSPRTKLHKQTFAEQIRGIQLAKEAVKNSRKNATLAEEQLALARKGKKNPEFSERTHKVLGGDLKIADEWGNPLAVPVETAAHIERLERFVMGQQDYVDEFVKGIDKAIGAWKIAVTILNPGYRIRNSMTDMWNMWLAGVPLRYMPKYFSIAAKAVLNPANPNSKYLLEASQRGVLAGLFAGDVQEAFRIIKEPSLKRVPKKVLPIKLMQDFNRNAENIGRLAHYIFRREVLKEGPEEAARMVRIAHFDYNELTEFEQRIMKRLFPFYTWTRKNVPYQVRQIFSKPGRYAAFPKMALEAQYAAAGEQPGVRPPGFLEGAFPIQIPGTSSFYVPQFGVSDLEILQSPGEFKRKAFLQLNPAIKVPMELIFNKNLFTGAPIRPEGGEGYSRAPVSDLGARLLSLIPGTNVGLTYRYGPKGEKVWMQGADPNLVHLLGLIPWARAALVSSGTAEKRGRTSPWVSQIAGQTIVPANPEQEAMYERIRLTNKVDQLIKQYREEGVIPPAKSRLSKFDKKIEQILRGGYSGP